MTDLSGGRKKKYLSLNNTHIYIDILLFHAVSILLWFLIGVYNRSNILGVYNTPIII